MIDAVAENPHAGQGAVLLDIGEDSGALVVTCPKTLLGREVGILSPTGAPLDHLRHPASVLHSHSPGGSAHSHSPGGSAHSHHDHPAHESPPHVGVVARPLPSGETLVCAVFPGLRAGDYAIWLLPDGEATPATVTAGEVATVTLGACHDR